MYLCKVPPHDLDNSVVSGLSDTIDIIDPLRHASDLFQEFINDVHSATSQLTSVDTSAEEFVEKLTFLSKAKDMEEPLNIRCQEIQSLYELIDQHNIAVPEIDRAAFATLTPDFRAMKNAMEEVESMRDDNIQKYSGDLEAGERVMASTLRSNSVGIL